MRSHRIGWLLALVAALWVVGCDPAEDGAPVEAETPAAVEVQDVEATFSEDADCFGIEVAGLAGEEIRCGTVAVPLHYDDPDGETIDVAVAVLSGSDEAAHEHPLLILGGGPGEIVIEPFLTLPQYRQVFDVGPRIIVMDQRGVGSSRPALNCPEVAEIDSQAAVDDVDALLDALRTCRSRLTGEGIDLDGFNHLANARDVAVVRRALGHDQIDVRGGSYGSQLALLAAEHDPEGIRSLILNSPIDPTANWVDGIAGGFEQALAGVVTACADDPACAEAVGDLEEAITRTVDRLEAEPQEVTVQPPGGREVTTTYTPATFLGGLFLLFYLPDGVAALPALVDLAQDGELAPLAQIVALLEQELERVSTGMHFSMLCSGEGALATLDASLGEVDSEVIRQHWAPGSLIGGELLDGVCDVWDVEAVYDPAEQTLDSGVPALIFTGALDHVTPPELGEQVHDDLATSYLVEVPDVGHSPLEALGLCGQEIVTGFLADPTTAPDSSCATDRRLQLLTDLAQAPG
ncbi:MAG: alpha/beta fold hydrolase [Egibacteraceae bacterium]